MKYGKKTSYRFRLVTSASATHAAHQYPSFHCALDVQFFHNFVHLSHPSTTSVTRNSLYFHGIFPIKYFCRGRIQYAILSEHTYKWTRTTVSTAQQQMTHLVWVSRKKTESFRNVCWINYAAISCSHLVNPIATPCWINSSHL